VRHERHRESDRDLKLILKSLKSLKAVDASPLFETNMPGWSTHPTMSIVKMRETSGKMAILRKRS